MKGQSLDKPIGFVLTNSGYQLRWDITTATDDNGNTVYNYEYNTKYIPKVLTRDEAINAIIREKYSLEDEIKLSFGRINDIDEKKKHEEYVLKVKNWVNDYNL